jgi:hypothetical protein
MLARHLCVYLVARFGRLSLASSQQFGVRSLHSSGILGKDATPQGFGQADRDASPLFQQVIQEATENLEQGARTDGSGSAAGIAVKEVIINVTIVNR